jgi:hypothetical protein
MREERRRMTTLDNKDVEKASDITTPYTDYRVDYLFCRSIGHSWRYSHVIIRRDTRNRIAQYEEVMICAGCATSKIRVMDKTGNILYTRYSYPERYMIHDGTPSVFRSRSGFRMEVMRRMGQESDDRIPAEEDANS